jgi:hypothetical protein
VKQERPPGSPPDRLTRSLQDLPAAQASTDFTDRVLAQVGTQVPTRAAEARRAALPALIGAGAAALGALALLLRPAGPLQPAFPGGAGRAGAEAATSLDGGELGNSERSEAIGVRAHGAGIGGARGDGLGSGHLGDGDPAALAAEIERLRQEQRDLAAEVESLRAHRRDPVMPVVYVGQSGDVDLILDLTRFQQRSRLDEGGEKR